MNEKTEILTTLRNMPAILGSLAKSVDRPALEFLIGMAELEAAQAEVAAKSDAVRKS